MFCLNYYPSQKYIQEADELKIKYRRADRTLPDFLEKYKDKFIIIDVSDSFKDIDAQLLRGLYKEYGNIKIVFDFYKSDYLSRAKKNEIPFFFVNPITTIDQLHGFLNYHPTDMYICEELGFSLEKIGKLLHDNNVRVRVYPNICQSSFPETPSIKTFFIRPEDISAYSAFVDVFELISDKSRQQTLFKIYKQEKWFGKIKDLIPTFKGELDSKYILSSFGAIRSKCGKRCMYQPDRCSICDRFLELADTLKENNIIVRKEKINN